MPKVVRRHEMRSEQRWMPQPKLVPTPGPSPEEVAEAHATEILRHAEDEAAAQVTAAQQEISEIRARAYQIGYEEGWQRGNAEAQSGLDEKKSEFVAQCTGLEALVKEVNLEREEFFDRMEPELVRLACSIAEKILTEQLTLEPGRIVEIARTHLQSIREREVVLINAHPDDLPRLQDARDFLQEIEGVREVQLIDDRRIDPGGMVLESEAGSLDARISAQLAVVTQALSSAAGKSHERPGN